MNAIRQSPEYTTKRNDLDALYANKTNVFKIRRRNLTAKYAVA
jgi:hypothetical protein